MDQESNKTLKSLLDGQAPIVLYVATVHDSKVGWSVADTVVQAQMLKTTQ